MKNQLQYLVISVIGKDELGAINELSALAATSSCNIKESRVASFGTEFGFIMLISGSWDTIAKFENALPSLAKRKDWQIAFRRSSVQEYEEKLLPYTVQVVALDSVGLIEQISGFFYAQGIRIRELYTTTYPASHTGTSMFSLTMSINVPATIQISELRERFILFCDDLNLDAIVEPDKL